MKTIWKIELKTADEQLIELPLSALILTMQTQNGKPCIWFLVDPDIPKEEWKEKKIMIYGIGHQIKKLNPGIYIGTYQLSSGDLIFHVFDEGYQL